MREDRNRAYRAGEKYFNTGLPCKRGHLSDRYVVNGACVQCGNFSSRPLKNIYYFVENNSRVVKIYAKDSDFELIKMIVDCYVAAKFPSVKVDGVNPFPFKRSLFISENIYRLKLLVPMEYGRAVEEFAEALLPEYKNLERPELAKLVSRRP